jgi:hypothetical protein
MIGGSMLAFRLLLVAMWLAVAAITAWALLRMGLAGGVETFLGDLSHPWRAQFYADLEAHLVLVAGWIVYRERSKSVGLMCAIATMLLGALFTLPYILIATVRAADGREVLMGRVLLHD